MKPNLALLIPVLIFGISGCGGVIQVTPTDNGAVIQVSGTNSGPGATAPAAPALPGSPTDSPVPDVPLPPPTVDTPPPGTNTPPPGTTAPPPDAPPAAPVDPVADSDPTPPDPQAAAVVPPLGQSSGGSGGSAPLSGTAQQAGGTNYNLIVPSSYSGSATPLLIVFSGVEGGQTMTSNLLNLRQPMGLGSFILAVLDGKVYFGNGEAGARVLDDVRARYNIDNDRTYLLSESAGTRAGETLGFRLRQSYFAAFWVNDVNNADTPRLNANQLGFAPWGQVGPGGQTAVAQSIANGMRTAGYRLPSTAVPYDGPGSTQHGNSQQFMAALRFFPGKVRQ